MSNVYLTFAEDHGYFAGDAQLNPLTHLWTLGVEMQFSFLLVAVLALLRALRANPLKPLAALCAFSFAGAEILRARYPIHAYYLLFPRCAELLAGCVTFLVPFTPLPFMAPLALLILLSTSFFYSASTPYPGLSSLLPTIATAMLLRAPLSVLDNRVLRYVGWLSLRCIYQTPRLRRRRLAASVCYVEWREASS